MLCLRVAGKHGPAGRIRWQSALRSREEKKAAEKAARQRDADIKALVDANRLSWERSGDAAKLDKEFDRIFEG